MHSWSAGHGGILETPAEDVLRRVDAIRELSKRHHVQKILDFGCGNGEMIYALKNFFEIEGLEPEVQARNNCLSAGLKIHPSTDGLLKNSVKFDLISLFHVVEHFYSPAIELKNIRDLLNPGGLLVIETPNSKDALLSEYKSDAFSSFTYWSHHPMLHSKTSLSSLVSRAGFQISAISGVQRYGLANHLYWLTHQSPGGHVVWSDKFSRETNQNYEKDLARLDASDTLWLVASVK